MVSASDFWPRADSEMARHIRAVDWASTPLGPIPDWPQSLRTIVDLMLRSTSMMSLVWGAEAIHLYNDSFTELLREHRLLSLGRSAYETFARSRTVFADDLAAGMAGRSARLIDQRYPVLRNGRLEDAWFDVEYAPVHDDAGCVAGVLWTLKETTAQHLAERALRASETRHRLLIESWAQAVWETDAAGVVAADSPSWRAYTGQTLEEWLGYGWLDAIHPDDRGYAERQWRAAVAAHGLVDAEFRLRAPDGGWRWTNVRAAPVLDAGGKIEKWAGMNIDIGARKRAEAALRASDERQTFQLRLSDALAPLTDSADIQAEATRSLAAQLDIGWCYVNEFDDRQTHATVLRDFHRDDLPSIVGVHDLSAERRFLDLMLSGAVLDMPDLASSEHFSAQAKATYGNLGIRSALGVPVLRKGRLAAVLLAADSRVRSWTRGDRELLRGAAERTWEAVQRARTEEALRASAVRLRGVLDGMTEGFGLLAQDFTILEHNAEALRLDGRSRDQIVGRSHWDAYPGTEDSELGRLLKRAMVERVPVSLEHIYAWESGRALWLDMRAYPVADGALAVFWRDVTDRREAELALKESEEKYRSLFGSMDEAYAVVEVLKDEAGSRVDFRFIEVNPAFLEHTSMPWPVGQTATELLGAPNPRWTELYGQALDTDAPIRVEESEPTLDRIFDLNIFALDQERNRVAVLFTNITERKRAEAALRESEALRRVALDGGGMGAWTWDTRANTVRADEVVQRLWGVSTDEQPHAVSLYTDLMYPEGAAGLAAMGALAAQDVTPGEDFHAQLQVASGATCSRWVELRGRAEHGRPWIINGVSFDITEEKAAAKRQEVLVNELQHRARNLLGVITAVAGRTVKQGGSVEAFEDRLQALSRAQGLLSKGGSDTVEVGALLRAELAVHEDAAAGRVTIAGPEVHLRARQVQNFALAVHELTTNAVKYGALKIETGRLVASWEIVLDKRARRRLALSWAETGVTIEPEKVTRRGYGTELIQEALAYALEAEVTYELGRDGVRCRIEMPIT